MYAAGKLRDIDDPDEVSRRADHFFCDLHAGEHLEREPLTDFFSLSLKAN
jgi:hypothetical protein